MTLELGQWLAAVFAGGLVGMCLGMLGAGGSILIVPLLLYLVGVPNAHTAIATGAVTVAANAAVGLAGHARAGNVNWRCGLYFAGFGMAGALVGSVLGKAVDSDQLLALFALMMLAVVARMFVKRNERGRQGVECTREKLPRMASYGIGAGLFSGFFGIGGGFLIVPGLVASTGMSALQAVGASLVAVLAFATTVAGSYALSGLVDWPLAATVIAGGVGGSMMGTRLCRHLGADTGRLSIAFAIMAVPVALYMLWRSLSALLG